MIYLRELKPEDYELIMAWRSNPLVYKSFYSQNKPLTWDEHIKWIKSRNKDWRNFIIILDDGFTENRVGVVTIGQLDYWEPETGIYIGYTDLWGKGIGKVALQLAVDYIKSYGRKYTRTTILDVNERSKKLYSSLGFKRIGEARPGESLYRKQI